MPDVNCTLILLSPSLSRACKLPSGPAASSLLQDTIQYSEELEPVETLPLATVSLISTKKFWTGTFSYWLFPHARRSWILAVATEMSSLLHAGGRGCSTGRGSKLTLLSLNRASAGLSTPPSIFPAVLSLPPTPLLLQVVTSKEFSWTPEFQLLQSKYFLFVLSVMGDAQDVSNSCN